MRRLLMVLMVFLLCSCNLEIGRDISTIDGTPKMDGCHIRIYSWDDDDVYCSLHGENEPSDTFIKLDGANLFDAENGAKYILDVFVGDGSFIYDGTSGAMNMLTEHHSTTEITITGAYTVVFIKRDGVMVRSE